MGIAVILQDTLAETDNNMIDIDGTIEDLGVERIVEAGEGTTIEQTIVERMIEAEEIENLREGETITDMTLNARGRAETK